MTMAAILRNEILKTFRKWRTYIGIIAIGVLVPVVQIAMKLEGGAMVKRMTRDLAADFILVGNLFNGYFVTYFIMNSLWVHVPFLIALVAGDQLAGEATGGTFRLLLIRPASRTRILFTKYVTALFYSFTLIAFLGLLSIGLGMFLFGSGDLLVAGSTLTILPQAELPFRMVIAFGLATLSMWCVASLAFFFSSLVENAIGPIIGTMAVIIIFFIVSNIPVELFESVKPFLFTTYFGVWSRAFEDPIAWETILRHSGILIGHAIGFYLITWYIFIKKDVLS
jgi:ABC-2 type transport system permease protein